MWIFKSPKSPLSLFEVWDGAGKAVLLFSPCSQPSQVKTIEKCQVCDWFSKLLALIAQCCMLNYSVLWSREHICSWRAWEISAALEWVADSWRKRREGSWKMHFTGTFLGAFPPLLLMTLFYSGRKGKEREKQNQHWIFKKWTLLSAKPLFHLSVPCSCLQQIH